MKKILLLVLYLTLSVISFSQSLSVNTSANSTARPDKFCYYREAQKIMATYNCSGKQGTDSAIMVLDRTLDTLFKPIFSTVILDNNGVIKNGSSGSIAQDAAKGTLSINFSKKIWQRNFLNIGLFTESNGSFLQFFSPDGWNSNVGVNFGYTRIRNNCKQYFKKASCEELTTKRNQQITILLKKYAKVLETDTGKLHKAIDSIQAFFRLSDPNAFFANNDINLDTASKKLSELIDLNKEYIRLTSHSENENLQADICEFEKNNAKFTGYKVKWWQYGFGFSNNKNKLYNDTLLKDQSVGFTTKDFARYKFSVSYNFNRSLEHNITFFSIGLNCYNTNFLENRAIKDIPRLDSIAGAKIIADVNDGTVYGNLEDLKKNIWIFNPTFYYSHFFGKAKFFGLASRCEFKNANFFGTIPNGVTYNNSFTSTLSLLFRIVDEKDKAIAKSTIGIEAGFIDANVDTHVWKDFFTARVSVGVPFSTILK